MFHLNSARLPATVIFTALLLIIMLSASRTTYQFAPVQGGYSLAGCDSKPATLPPRRAEPVEACPAPPSRSLSHALPCQTWPLWTPAEDVERRADPAARVQPDAD